MGATIIRNIPAFGAYFGCFEYMRRALTPPGEKPTLWASFVGGSAAGLGFWASVYPVRPPQFARVPVARLFGSLTVCCFGVLLVPRSWSSSSLACKLMPATRPSASTGASCTACARRWRRRASAGPSRASCRASLGLYLSTAPSSWRCRGRRVSSRTRASSGAPPGPPCCPLAHVGMPSSSLLLPCSCVAGVLLPRDRFLAAAAASLDAVRWQQLGWRGWVGDRSAVASPC